MASPINDLELSESLTRITGMVRRASNRLNDGDNGAAFLAFMLIETTAHEAMLRLNALKYATQEKPK